MTVPESNKPLTTVAIISSATSAKVHSFVRQTPVTSTSFQVSQDDALGRGDHPNGRVSVQPTSFEGGLLVGLYDLPILDESLSTQLDNSDDDNTQHQQRQKAQNACRIDPNQVIDTLKSTFLELDELLLATAITVALAQPEDTKLTSEGEIKKAQEVVAQVVTGSTALVGFLAPHITPSSTTTPSSTDSTELAEDQLKRYDFYLAQLGDSVAILAGLDEQGQWTARRLNPPETHEHSVRYPGSEEYRKVVSEAKERALTAEQFLTQHNGHHKSQQDNSPETATTTSAQESFLTRDGKFLGLPVTRAFGDLDWKIEQEARYSVANWVEKSLRAKIDKTLGGGHGQTASTTTSQQQDEIGINNLNDPPYVAADPKISRFVLETRKHLSGNANDGPSDQLLILLNRGLLYSAAAAASTQETTNSSEIKSPYDQALISDFELSRVAADTLEQGENNCALAVAKALDLARKEIVGEKQEGEELEGSIVVVTL
ncbi:hypothetical protein BGZ51_000979 [Haplosporangium sp. Z 767]|nr:hypothetical protein BGZ51_000979 [Haplosporangium sp. Z 767]KAF9189735.1 hypothetical protein BGZ50_000604 [Haplosporangium sp. Z 11]